MGGGNINTHHGSTNYSCVIIGFHRLRHWPLSSATTNETINRGHTGGGARWWTSSCGTFAVWPAVSHRCTYEQCYLTRDFKEAHAPICLGGTI